MEPVRRPPKKFQPIPFAYHQEIELRIDSLTNLGKGVGRVDGWVVFVPYVIPGELVRARVFSNAKRFSEADLVEVLEASPARITPRCAIHGRCGGCQYQHLAYEEQLRWKQRQVEELLEHMAGLTMPVEPVIASPQLYGYRSKITPHFKAPREGKIDEIGFLRPGRGQQLVDVPQCPIAMPALNEELSRLRADVHRRAAEFKRGATLLLRANDGEPPVLTDARATCRQRVGSLFFEFPAGEFFQNNPFILEAFARHVADEARAGNSRFLIDAYCGSGLFSLFAASKFEACLGVEVSELSIHWAEHNARLNGINNCRFLLGKAETLFPRCEFPGRESTVVIDPPRRGSDEVFLSQLFELRPQRVVYVSCNPATQMRDLIAFRDAGYELVKIQPFDLFPQTRHLECVATLVDGR